MQPNSPQPPYQGVPQQQPQYPYPTQPYPYYTVPVPPKANHTVRVIIAVIVAVVIIVALALASTVLLRPSLAAPRMTITNFQLNDQRSCLLTQGGYIYATFDLVNTGGNGFARVAFTVDSVTDHTNNFFVQGDGQLHVSEPVDVSDCNSHYIGAQVTSEWTG